MASLDMMSGSQPTDAVAAEAARWEKIGRWLMAGYWLAMLGMMMLGGIAAGH